MANEPSVVKKIETAFDDFLDLCRNRPWVSALVAFILLGFVAYCIRSRAPASVPHPQTVITVQGVDLDKYEQQFRERFRLEEDLRHAQAALNTATTGKEQLAEEVARLKNELADAKTHLERAERAGGIIYSRSVFSWGQLDSEKTEVDFGRTEVVYLEDGRPRVDDWMFLPKLRRVRRITRASEMDLTFGVATDEVLVDRIGSDAFLNPVFWPGDKICRDDECGTVRQALPGIIPLYQIERQDKTTLVWYENTLGAGIEFQHDAAGTIRQGTFMGSGGLLAGVESSFPITGNVRP